MEKGVNKHPLIVDDRTVGQRIADKMTLVMGSWAFIVTFSFFLVVWIIINAYLLVGYGSGKVWDPYPFILLNLVLSCLAAFQAPIILMSQNREAQKDRLTAIYDYNVNMKAEKEIREIKEQLSLIARKLK